MIQAAELRGNWLIHEGEQMNLDTEQMHLLIGLNAFDELFPIPLTPEILIACGFKATEYTKHKTNPHIPQSIRDMDFFDYRKYTLLIENPQGEYWRCFYTTDPETVALIGKIESLHQLQNLYFGLTNTELNYQP